MEGGLGLDSQLRQREVPTCHSGLVLPETTSDLLSSSGCASCKVVSGCPTWITEMPFQQTGFGSFLRVERQEVRCWPLPLCCGAHMVPEGVKLAKAWLQLRPRYLQTWPRFHQSVQRNALGKETLSFFGCEAPVLMLETREQGSTCWEAPEVITVL